MPNLEWNPRWGQPEDSNIVEGRTELGGRKVGDRVRALTDGDQDEGCFFADDEGVVVGVAVTAPGLFNPSEKTELIVAFDGMDPTAATPGDLEVIG